jgi:hypothetical protein
MLRTGEAMHAPGVWAAANLFDDVRGTLTPTRAPPPPPTLSPALTLSLNSNPNLSPEP